jgi:hypothetical protein
VEIHTNTYWTPDLTRAFKKTHGYDIGKYVMLLAVDNGIGFGAVYPDRVYTDEEDRGEGYVADYRATMSSLLTDYYKHLVKWSEKYLGMEFSAQVGYNLPVDMVCLVNLPIETFNFPNFLFRWRLSQLSARQKTNRWDLVALSVSLSLIP